MEQENLINIIDNNRINPTHCNDCNKLLRYEYHTNKGVYGSECIHNHIHPDYQFCLTYKPKEDMIILIGINNTLQSLNNVLCNKQITEFNYREFPNDVPVMINENMIGSGTVQGRRIFIQNLLSNGWTITKKELSYIGKNIYDCTIAKK